MEHITKKWLERARYDLRTAEAMLETRRYLYVAFMCQQNLEKTLKAIYTHKRKEIPPRTHNLLYLIELLKISITKEQKIFLLVD